MTIKIQTFQRDYQNQVVELISAIQQKEFNLRITPDEQPDLRNPPDYYQKGKGNFWIALDENKVVGTVALLDIGGDEGALRKMFVQKDYRGEEKGIAKMLLYEVLQWAKGKNLTAVYLGVTPFFVAAYHFYEKHGFVEIPKKDLPLRFPIQKLDDRFFKYAIT